MNVVPFPRTRHRPFILKHARNIASYGGDSGERYLQAQLRVQCETMERRGIDPVVIQRERDALERAIRVALWQLTRRRPGGAA